MLCEKCIGPLIVSTVERVGFLRVVEGRRAPDAHRAVVRGGRHEPRDGRVPAHAVDGTRVAHQLRDGKLAPPVPNVHFVVCGGGTRATSNDLCMNEEDKQIRADSNDYYFSMNG